MSLPDTETPGTGPSKGHESASGAVSYERLRSWYLASLRRSIVKQMEHQQMTPAALIAADREAVERLVSSSGTATKTVDRSTRTGSDQKDLIDWLWLAPLLAVLPASLLLAVSSKVDASWLLACLAAGGVGAAAALAFYLIKAIDRKIAAMKAQTDQTLSSTMAISKLQAAEPGASGDETASSRQGFAGLQASLDELSTSFLMAQERERAIVDYALDFICAIDATGRFAAVGPSSISFCGFSPVELMGRSIIDLVAAEDKERTEKFLQAIKKATAPVPFEHRIKRKDGLSIDVRWLAEWSEREQSLFCVGKDVSIERRLERLRKEFVSMVSHDLRTPLTAVELSVQLLEEIVDDKGSEAQDHLQSIGKSVKRLLALINELLDLEKMESGKLPMNVRAKPLQPVLERSIEGVKSFSAFKNVQVHLAPTELSGLIDEERLIQVVVNLLSNAIKFSPEGSTITVGATAKRTTARVTITDQGPGIAPAMHELIFERFAQASDDDRKHGSGLGLSICKVIIDSHGGTIGVASEPGKGSSFWFEVPLA